jgi:hypothetical protein
MKVQQRGRFEDDRGTDQPARAQVESTEAGDHAIKRGGDWATVFGSD